VDYDAAAALYRTCRHRGQSLRKPIDCLIAAIAVRGDVPVPHMDAEFEVLAEHTSLQDVETQGACE